ncbi:MAG: hypothetical protein ABJH63_05160 [Rhizobiaceae bacterium]
MVRLLQALVLLTATFTAAGAFADDGPYWLALENIAGDVDRVALVYQKYSTDDKAKCEYFAAQAEIEHSSRKWFCIRAENNALAEVRRIVGALKITPVLLTPSWNTQENWVFVVGFPNNISACDNLKEYMANLTRNTMKCSKIRFNSED